MRRILLALAIAAAFAAAAHAQIWLMSPASQTRGKGGPPPVLTNLRITNTGAFRITNTGANRAVFP